MLVLRRMAMLLEVSMAVAATVASATTSRAVTSATPRCPPAAFLRCRPGTLLLSILECLITEAASLTGNAGPGYGAVQYRDQQTQCAPVLGFQCDFRGYWWWRA